MEQHLDLTELLAYINPAPLTYQEWLQVGMALKAEGYAWTDWDAWSRSDTSRYHANECRKKWQGFGGEGITGATITMMAKENGWTPRHDGGRPQEPASALAWESVIDGDERAEPVEPVRKGMTAEEQVVMYLQALFNVDDIVGFVMQSFRAENGKYLPNGRGSYKKTAGEIIREIQNGHSIGEAMGDYDPEAGAWIRFNPLSGEGVRNSDVTDFRYALVESDSLPLEVQRAKIADLNLPVAAIVYSGRKSVHAIVRVDAEDAKEYRKRVEFLYKTCAAAGLEVDENNKNPSRLSRLPGVKRGDKEQYLVATKCGAANWAEWEEAVNAMNDGLPDPEELATEWDNLPDLAPELIRGILREGHKMLISGPSKAGKSFLLIELAISIAEGLPWLGMDCRKGRVLYVNLELDAASCKHRFRDVAAELGVTHAPNVDMWNLRGAAVPLDKLAPRLISRSRNRGYIAVIIDPIYKVITGDENSADQMAKFCNQFDLICKELGCAAIYCHHHSKGNQGGKKSADRASGSGVFARDPDAMLDLIELPVTEAVKQAEGNTAYCNTAMEWLRAQRPGAAQRVPQDIAVVATKLREWMELNLDRQTVKTASSVGEAARTAAAARTAWRISGILREFAPPAPVNVWFDYPVHRNDAFGTLADIQPEAESSPWKRNIDKAKKQQRDRKEAQIDGFAIAYDSTVEDPEKGLPVEEIADILGVSDVTIRRWLGKGKQRIGALAKEFELIVVDDSGAKNVRRIQSARG